MVNSHLLTFDDEVQPLRPTPSPRLNPHLCTYP